MAVYMDNKQVTVVRPAMHGDRGYNPGAKGPQVVILDPNPAFAGTITVPISRLVYDDEEKPVVTGIDPASLPLDGPDTEVFVTGTGFTEVSVILWNGGEEPTVFYDETSLSTIVKPSTASGEITIPVAVRTGIDVSDPVDFSFTAAGTAPAAGRAAHPTVESGDPTAKKPLPTGPAKSGGKAKPRLRPKTVVTVKGPARR